MKNLAIALFDLAYLILVIGTLSVAKSRFETLVLAGLVLLFALVLFSFLWIAHGSDNNTYIAWMRYRKLAAAHGITEDDDGKALVDREKALEELKGSQSKSVILQIGNWAVVLYVTWRQIQEHPRVHGKRNHPCGESDDPVSFHGVSPKNW